MIYPSLITALTLLMYMVIVMLVAKARGRYAVAAPAISGNADFERRYRVQMNTLEQMVLFLPSMWLFEVYWVPQVRLGITCSASHFAAALGAVWLFGRILYAYGYFRAPQKRGLGFAISFVASSILLLWACVGVLYVVFHLSPAAV
jgi:uncharacterized membrane protein YecN with MAPEG domain